jgi:hypothetical protein
MSKEDKDLIVVHEDNFDFNGTKINYAVLDNNAVLIAYSSILKLLNVTANEVKHIKPVAFWNSKKKWNNGLYLEEIPKILFNLVEEAETETLSAKAAELLKELSYFALKQLTGEQEIKEKPQPTFDQLLSGLLKVPPPKK